MTLPIRSVTQPKALAGQSNGKLPASRLVDTPGQAGGPAVRLLEVATRGWRAMCAAARAAGHVLKATSLSDTYRPYAEQESLFRRRYTTAAIPGRPTKTWQGLTWWLRPGMATAAVPGTSTHGWGLAVDVGEERDGDAGTESIDAGTVAWLIGNAHLYGFSAELQSEPWHWRYFAGDAIPPAVLAFEQGDDMYEQYDRDRLNATLGKVEAIEEAVAKLAAPQVTVDLGDLASRVLANAGFADAIATAVADKLAARLKE